MVQLKKKVETAISTDVIKIALYKQLKNSSLILFEDIKKPYKVESEVFKNIIKLQFPPNLFIQGGISPSRLFQKAPQVKSEVAHL